MPPTEQADRARALRDLHVRGAPLVLFNVWDAGSAREAARRGAAAVATASWAVAAAHGTEDGERLDLDAVLANARRIVEATDLPTTVDVEGGYGADAEGVRRTIARLVDVGAVGCNVEDSLPGTTTLRSADEQCRRLEAARRAFDDAGVPGFLNARTDVFLAAPADADPDALVEEALARARAYAAAGADGIFVPGAADEGVIGRLAAGAPLPLNVMATDRTPPKGRLAALGVARISHGPGPYRLAMRAFGEAAAQAFA